MNLPEKLRAALIQQIVKQGGMVVCLDRQTPEQRENLLNQLREAATDQNAGTLEVITGEPSYHFAGQTFDNSKGNLTFLKISKPA